MRLHCISGAPDHYSGPAAVEEGGQEGHEVQIPHERAPTENCFEVEEAEVGLRSERHRLIEALNGLVQSITETAGILLFELLQRLLLAQYSLSSRVLRIPWVLLFISLARQHVLLLNFDAVINLVFLLFLRPLLFLELLEEHAIALIL